jgi:ElaB/YqjD/DUF883 family membrane-anchored ribosome-binding protein
MSATPKSLHETHDLDGDLGTIRSDLNTLREDLARITSGLNHGLKVRITDGGERAAKAVTQQITEQPVISLVIAAALGFVGGRLLQR